nr:MAG TPA: hypothetical protein [Caudoviricetes sp.]
MMDENLHFMQTTISRIVICTCGGILHNVEYKKEYDWDIINSLLIASYKVIKSNLIGLMLDDENEILNIFPQYENGKVIYSVWIQGREYLSCATMTELDFEDIKEAMKEDDEEELIGFRYRDWEVSGVSFVDKLHFNYKVYFESNDGRVIRSYFKTLDKMSILEKLKELNQEV